MFCPGNDRERLLLSPETSYKDCFWIHSLLHMFWLWVLERQAFGTDVQCRDGRGDPGGEPEIEAWAAD